MHESALDWGRRHRSCIEALEAREALGPDATQADWWRVCPRGDWLLWQWARLPASTREVTSPAIQRAIDRIVARAIRRGQQSLRGVRSPEATAWRRWARRWLDGSDRTGVTADAADSAAARAAAWDVAWVAARVAGARAAAWTDARDVAWVAARVAGGAAAGGRARGADWAANRAANRAAERLRQARDIRRELPEWPGEDDE